MSYQLINHSSDLKRLRDEGYNLEIRSGYLLIKDVPYVNSRIEVKRGTLVSTLTLAGNMTTKPDDHVVCFAGDYPCHEDGKEIEQIRNQSVSQLLAEGVPVDHRFSAKPQPAGNYENYYTKMTTYVSILSGPASIIIPGIKANTFPIIETGKEDKECVFNYIDTASSRAEISLITEKLGLRKVAIVGLGGTGSYVLDLIAKAPIREIHLFDGDVFLQHNAFRSPGAPSIDDLKMKPFKATYFKNLYSKMHRGIFDHSVPISLENIDQLGEMDFVFLCIDTGHAKKLIINKLEEFRISFVDVGMGIYQTDCALAGIVRTTTSTPQKRDHLQTRVSFSDDEAPNEYASNIQIADLNSLNAALAVIKWKKIFGFYNDLECEHNSTYTIDGNTISNGDYIQ